MEYFMDIEAAGILSWRLFLFMGINYLYNL